MSKLILVKDFLGKVFTDMSQNIKSSDKYKYVGLENFFEQRFLIQHNKVQMIIDHSLTGLRVVVNGNEIQISPELYHHPFVRVSNSIEQDTQSNSRKLFSSNTFSTMSYLVCQNHSMFQISENLMAPIYITFKTDYESFYNSVLLFIIDSSIDLEIVEEIESHCALNNVSNYIVNKNAKLNLSTFYQNQLSAESFSFRNIIAMEESQFTHNLAGKSSAKILDEIKVTYHKNSKISLNGMIYGKGGAFHSVINTVTSEPNNDVNINYKTILENKAKITLKSNVEIKNASTANVKIQNLILNDNCFIMAKPVLDIKSDEAICFHGVTNSTINEDELVYLMSRNISKEDAFVMLKKSFFEEIIDKVDIKSKYGTGEFYDYKERFILSI